MFLNIIISTFKISVEQLHKKSKIHKCILLSKNFTKNQIFADNSLPALNLATFLALILITAPV